MGLNKKAVKYYRKEKMPLWYDDATEQVLNRRSVGMDAHD